MSLTGEPSFETLRKRKYRARLLRERDPAQFYLRRHKRKQACHTRKVERYAPFSSMDELAALFVTSDDLAAMCWKVT